VFVEAATLIGRIRIRGGVQSSDHAAAIVSQWAPCTDPKDDGFGLKRRIGQHGE